MVFVVRFGDKVMAMRFIACGAGERQYAPAHRILVVGVVRLFSVRGCSVWGWLIWRIWDNFVITFGGSLSS